MTPWGEGLLLAHCRNFETDRLGLDGLSFASLVRDRFYSNHEGHEVHEEG